MNANRNLTGRSWGEDFKYPGLKEIRFPAMKNDPKPVEKGRYGSLKEISTSRGVIPLSWYR
jgi:hypothetical protein